MINRQVRGDAPQPSPTVAVWVETVTVLIKAPEGFDCQIFGGAGVADNAHDPAVDLALVLSKKRFEGLDVTRGESLQNAHLAPLFILTRSSPKRLHFEVCGCGWQKAIANPDDEFNLWGYLRVAPAGQSERRVFDIGEAFVVSCRPA